MIPEELRIAYKRDTGTNPPDLEKLLYEFQIAEQKDNVISFPADDCILTTIFPYLEWLQRKASVTIAKEKIQTQKKAAEEFYLKMRNK